MDRREAFGSIMAGIAALIGIKEEDYDWDEYGEDYDWDADHPLVSEPKWWEQDASNLAKSGFFDSGKSAYLGGIKSVGVLLVNDHDYYLTPQTNSMDQIVKNCECWDLKLASMKTNIIDPYPHDAEEYCRVDLLINPAQFKWESVESDRNNHLVAVTLSGDANHTPLTYHRFDLRILGGDITIDFGDGKIGSIL